MHLSINQLTTWSTKHLYRLIFAILSTVSRRPCKSVINGKYYSFVQFVPQFLGCIRKEGFYLSLDSEAGPREFQRRWNTSVQAKIWMEQPSILSKRIESFSRRELRVFKSSVKEFLNSNHAVSEFLKIIITRNKLYNERKYV